MTILTQLINSQKSIENNVVTLDIINTKPSTDVFPRILLPNSLLFFTCSV